MKVLVLKIEEHIISIGRLKNWQTDILSDLLPSSLWRTTDPKLPEITGLFYRLLGFFLGVVEIYLAVFGIFEKGFIHVWPWVLSYFSYLILLEIVRVHWKYQFDRDFFRIIRMII